MNVNDNYKCQTCFDLIPDCSECEQVEKPVGDEFIIDIGYDADLSSKKGNYLTCKLASEGMI